jgi:hypothetical protein
MIGTFLLVVLVAGAFVLSTNISNTSSNTNSLDNNGLGQPPADSTSVTLNSVAYADQVIHANLTLPNLAALGSGFQIVGVQIVQPPTSATLSNNVSYVQWIAKIYISNEGFVNGSTSDTNLEAHSVIVAETNTANSSTSLSAAESYLAPSQMCALSLSTTTQDITTVTVTASSSCTVLQNTIGHLIEYQNTYLAVEPAMPSALFQVAGTNLEFQVLPGVSATATSAAPIMTYQQLLALSENLIQSTSNS